MNIVEKWYKEYSKNSMATLRLVRYKLDFNRYHNLILSGLNEKMIREIAEFKPCD